MTRAGYRCERFFDDKNNRPFIFYHFIFASFRKKKYCYFWKNENTRKTVRNIEKWKKFLQRHYTGTNMHCNLFPYLGYFLSINTKIFQLKFRAVISDSIMARNLNYKLPFPMSRISLIDFQKNQCHFLKSGIFQFFRGISKECEIPHYNENMKFK